MMSYFIRFKAVITAIGAGILQEGLYESQLGSGRRCFSWVGTVGLRGIGSVSHQGNRHCTVGIVLLK